MNQKIEFNPFAIQNRFIKSMSRKVGAFCGKRSGKTEGGAIRSGRFQELKPNWKPNGIDPYLGVIIAPTTDMLRRLSLKKFLAYFKPAIKKHNESTNEIWWHDHDKVPGGSQIYGLSADKPSRIEGIKANWIWCDEILQMEEQLFLEAIARLSDSKGYLWVTGSLGVQYTNPKQHWDLYELAEKLVDLEDYFRQWRHRHVTTVQRVIGFKRGTGGTAGVGYLRAMLEVRLFPELWDLRTEL